MNTHSLLAAARRAAWPMTLAVTSAVAGTLAAQTGDSAVPTRDRGDRALPARTFSDRRKDEEQLGERLREGTRITDVKGSFQFSGDRVAFHPDHLSHQGSQGQPDGKRQPDGKSYPNGKGDKGESFRVLENLALERINSELGQARGNLQWTVSGIVTEFRGNNYLLVTKAVVLAAASAP